MPWSTLRMLPAASSEAEAAKPDPHHVSAQVWHPAGCQSPVTPFQLPARASFTSLCRGETLAERGVQPEVSSTLPLPSQPCVGWGAEVSWLLAVFAPPGLCIPCDEVLQPRRPHSPQCRVRLSLACDPHRSASTAV